MSTASNRERIGELIQRVGMPAFLDGIGLDPAPEMVSAPRDNPSYSSRRRRRTRNDNDSAQPRITDIGPPRL